MKKDRMTEEQREQIIERYGLAIERIEQIPQEMSVKEPYASYFKNCAEFILTIKKEYEQVASGEKKEKTLEQLQRENKALYEDILEENYGSSYANPAYAHSVFDEKYAKSLCFLYTELRAMIVYAYEERIFDLTILCELFIEIYNYFEEEDDYTYKDVRKAIYYFVSDYLDVTTEYRTFETFDPEMGIAKDIILNSDLTDLRYLYQYGDYITENELKIAEFLNAMPEEQVRAMASTYTEGYKRGFAVMGIDMSKKSTVNIRFSIGFERMIRIAIEQFRAMGLEPVLYRAAVASANKKPTGKVGYYATSPNRQYEYDHRFDLGLYFDKAYVQRKLVCTRQAFEAAKEYVERLAGPALIEVFGEKRFEPVNKPESIQLDDKQTKLFTEYNRDNGMLSNEYIKGDEISFTIIAYPIPEIGERFEEIFADTVKLNTLDNEKYMKIQQAMIDSLDQGDYVHIVGSGDNQTDLKVNLIDLKDPSKETLFENCTADVNIPVGEVFTSPKLLGTDGVLHVSQVFLNGLEYLDLKLTFKDGRVADYTCKNFEVEEENKRYIKENLLYSHDTLPIGEFAIGTNTTAYMMGRKYDINDKLPILIAEKTGPHFAIGDTCYSHMEDMMTYNPDGRAIIARENEVSALRHTKPEEAYLNCHTDITIPYNELKEITVVRHDQTTETIIRDGRFVLGGTEELNDAFAQS